MRFGSFAKLEEIKIIRDAGYDYVELPIYVVKAESPESEFEPVRRQIKSSGIIPEAWCWLLGGDMKVTGPEVDLRPIEQYFHVAFKRIALLGGEIVVFGSGKGRSIPDGFSREKAWGQLVEFVKMTGQIAALHGLTLVVEPLNTGETNMINRVPEAVNLAEAVSHPSVRVLADLYHMSLENDPVSSVIEAGNLLAHAHIADTDRRYPGSGSNPSQEFVQALRSIGYNGRLSVECVWGDIASDSVMALEFLRKLCEP